MRPPRRAVTRSAQKRTHRLALYNSSHVARSSTRPLWGPPGMPVAMVWIPVPIVRGVVRPRCGRGPGRCGRGRDPRRVARGERGWLTIVPVPVRRIVVAVRHGVVCPGLGRGAARDVERPQRKRSRRAAIARAVCDRHDGDRRNDDAENHPHPSVGNPAQGELLSARTAVLVLPAASARARIISPNGCLHELASKRSPPERSLRARSLGIGVLTSFEDSSRFAGQRNGTGRRNRVSRATRDRQSGPVRGPSGSSRPSDRF